MDNPSEPKMWIFRVPELHWRRAPGNTCLTAIRTSGGKGTPNSPINNSKGCGTVMRAAPFGLAWREKDETSVQRIRRYVFRSAVEDAALTHGHPFAYYSSAALALIVYEAVNHKNSYKSLDKLSLFVINILNNSRFEEVTSLMNQAIHQASDHTISDLDGIHALGEGWVAEEALAIALFCAIRHQNDFAEAIRVAVNHAGDSDSTGAICGNILGAWLGIKKIEASMDIEHLELTDTILMLANDLIACANGSDLIKSDVDFYNRYHNKC